MLLKCLFFNLIHFLYFFFKLLLKYLLLLNKLLLNLLFFNQNAFNFLLKLIIKSHALLHVSANKWILLFNKLLNFIYFIVQKIKLVLFFIIDDVIYEETLQVIFELKSHTTKFFVELSNLVFFRILSSISLSFSFFTLLPKCEYQSGIIYKFIPKNIIEP